MALYLLLGGFCIAWGFLFGLAAPFKIMPLVAPIALLLLVIVWTLPDGEYAPTNAIEPLYIAFFVSLIIWPNYVAISLPNMPWMTMLRIFAAPLILITLICVSVSSRFRDTMKETIGHDNVLWKILLLFVALQTITLPLSDRPVVSLNRYIVDQLYHTSIFLISCYVFLKPGFAQRWALALLVMVYIVCAMGLWEASIGGLPWAGHIPSFLKIETDLVANILDGARRAAIGAHRVQAMTNQPLVMAELLGLAAPFALHIGLNRNPLLLRIVALAYLPTAALLIELADSRLGNVALLCAVLFYVLIWASLKWRQNRQSLIAPALVLVYPVILAGAVVGSFILPPLRRMVWGGGAKSGSTAAREAQWNLAIPEVLTHPFGHGLGQAARKVGYLNPAGTPTLDSHYINMLMDFGPMGFVLFYGLFFYAAWMAARVVIYYRPRGDTTLLLPLMVAMLQFVIIKSVLSIDANHPLVFMMLGAVVALAYRAKRQDELAAGRPLTA